MASNRRRALWLLATVGAALVFMAFLPWLVGAFWRIRSSNPVRRGIARSAELGCFHCHGTLGESGIPDPGIEGGDVPAWSGGVWMMYVKDDDDIRAFILKGSAARKKKPPQADRQAVFMPAYEDVLGGSDLEDLVAAFKAASGMIVPPPEAPSRRGFELARKWRCFACHGIAGSGGRSNPGSLTGFVPGWYGADFEDLVRNREEFDTWVRKGAIPRIEASLFASYFTRRQRIAMPRYESLPPEDLDALWAYTQWLKETGGGLRGGETRWQP